MSGLEPSGYTVEVESVLLISFLTHAVGRLHCTFPMLLYILSISIYTGPRNLHSPSLSAP